jgi:hypothetical protein
MGDATSPSLDELCSRLHRNDPELTIVDLTPPMYHGHGVRIGQALLENSKVTELTFAIQDLVSGNDVFHSGRYPLLQYLRTNKVVRELTLSNGTLPSDPNEVLEIDRLRGLVMDAVAQNSNIASFACVHRFPIEPMAQLLTRTISLTQLFLSVQRSIAHDSRTLERFAGALRMNQTLESLILFQPSGEERVMDYVLLPIASHPTLKLLCVDFKGHELTIMPRGLIRLLHSRSVKVKCLFFVSKLFDISSWNLLCGALKGNLSVRSLSFKSCSIAVPQSSILKLVRENGGLHALRDSSQSSGSNHPTVLAYCQRNVQLPDLLVKGFVHGRAGSLDGGGNSLSLLPTLLAAAQQAPRPAPNLITGKRSRTSMNDER